MSACNPTPASAGSADPEGACSGTEAFALRVLGNDMAPEFNEGEIIIIEPDGALKDGSFVLARANDEWVFRQLRQRGSAWALCPTNPERPDLPELPLPDLSAVRGVVIQKAVPGRRKLTKFYV
jgi:SOS-response transcriptional repressor LexA